MRKNVLLDGAAKSYTHWEFERSALYYSGSGRLDKIRFRAVWLLVPQVTISLPHTCQTIEPLKRGGKGDRGGKGYTAPPA